MLLLLLNSLVLIAISALLFAPRKGFLPLELKYVVFSPPISGFCPSKSSKTDEPPNEDELYDVVFTELRSLLFVSLSLSLSLSLLLLLFAPKTVVEDEVIQTNRSLDAEDDVVKVRLLVRVARFFNARSFAREDAQLLGATVLADMFESRCFFSRARESRRGEYNEG